MSFWQQLTMTQKPQISNYLIKFKTVQYFDDHCAFMFYYFTAFFYLAISKYQDCVKM